MLAMAPESQFHQAFENHMVCMQPSFGFMWVMSQAPAREANHEPLISIGSLVASLQGSGSCKVVSVTSRNGHV